MPGADNKLIAGSFAQARVVFRVLRAELGELGYRFENSNQSHQGRTRRDPDARDRARCERADAVRVSWRPAPGRRRTGRGDRRYVGGDCDQRREDADAYPVRGHHRASEQATLVARTDSGRLSTWGARESLTGQAGDVGPVADQYDGANPLVAVNPRLRQTLLRERDAARRDERLRARFLSLRLNLPTGDAETELIATHEWERMLSRAVLPRDGAAVLGDRLGRVSLMVGGDAHVA